MFTDPSPSESLRPSSNSDCAASSTGVLGFLGSSPSASSAQFGNPSSSVSSQPSSWPLPSSSGSLGSKSCSNSKAFDIPSPSQSASGYSGAPSMNEQACSCVYSVELFPPPLSSLSPHALVADHVKAAPTKNAYFHFGRFISFPLHFGPIWRAEEHYVRIWSSSSHRKPRPNQTSRPSHSTHPPMRASQAPRSRFRRMQKFFRRRTRSFADGTPGLRRLHAVPEARQSTCCSATLQSTWYRRRRTREQT